MLDIKNMLATSKMTNSTDLEHSIVQMEINTLAILKMENHMDKDKYLSMEKLQVMHIKMEGQNDLFHNYS